MISEAIAAVEQAAEKASPKLTARLRREAWQADWSTSALRSLVVNAEQTRMWVSGSEEAGAEEYGGLENLPKPVVRQFRNQRAAIDATILAQVEKDLHGKWRSLA